jgi:hypothetical protein
MDIGGYRRMDIGGYRRMDIGGYRRMDIGGYRRIGAEVNISYTNVLAFHENLSCFMLRSAV